MSAKAARQRSLLAQPWLRYGLPAALVAVYGWLWNIVGDPVGALLSLIVLGLGVALVSLVPLYFIVNAPGFLRWLRGISPDDHLKQLEADGKAVRENYRMRRAMTFEDWGTSSIAHLIELDDGRLLCLHGQYYYDFEPIDDDPEVNQPRRFPTSEFSLLRDARNGTVLMLTPGNEVVAPTVCAPIAKYKKMYELGIRLEDGELITGMSFEAAQKAVQAGAAPPPKARRK